MKNILVIRIDDRLIHGQVVTAWIKQYPINKILIIDDELSRNKLMERIYKAAAPVGVEVMIMDQEHTEIFLKEAPLAKEHIMVLVKVPQVLERLLQSGVGFDKIILGGMGAKPGRKTFNKNVSANEDETECFRRIIDSGVEIYYQLVPSEKEVNIRKLLS